MEFLRDHATKASHSLKRDCPESTQILESITNLKLEFTRLYIESQDSKLKDEISKLQEIVDTKKVCDASYILMTAVKAPKLPKKSKPKSIIRFLDFLNSKFRFTSFLIFQQISFKIS